jgi:DNA polymerase-4
MERLIIQLDLDRFFVSMERLHSRELIRNPVLVGGFSYRGVLVICSYEAWKFGVYSAIPMRLTRQLCP